MYKAGSERHTKLLSIGFEFQIESAMHKKSWDDRFGQLLDYRRKFGNCNVEFVDPMVKASGKMGDGGAGDTTNDGSLAEGELGSAKGEFMNEEEVVKAPCPDGICDSAIDRRAFGRWVKMQRAEFVKYMHGKKAKSLDKNRIRRLNEIGFDWGYAVEAAKREPTPSRGKLNRVAWDTRFSQLCEYLAEHGSTRVPQLWKPNPQLASWVAEQRKQYRLRSQGRPNSMTDERIVRLESVEFEWSVQDHSKRWMRKGKKEKESEKEEGGTEQEAQAEVNEDYGEAASEEDAYEAEAEIQQNQDQPTQHQYEDAYEGEVRQDQDHSTQQQYEDAYEGEVQQGQDQPTQQKYEDAYEGEVRQNHHRPTQQYQYGHHAQTLNNINQTAHQFGYRWGN